MIPKEVFNEVVIRGKEYQRPDAFVIEAPVEEGWIEVKEIECLTSLSTSRTKPLREIERARILLLTYQGKNDSKIAKE
ncbi:MAG: hypothetical protein Q8O41_06910, partial [Candidatus Methanoperedens sp.]|nr:hypothetical protein [Candidatus Methanoperedens sp.]